MSGITVRTALIIQNRKVRCEAGGPCKETGKYMGWIMLDVERWRPLLNTQPIYDSVEEAEQAMMDLVAAIKERNVEFPSLPQKEKEIISEIVCAAGKRIR